MAGRLGAWMGVPRLGLLLVAAAFMLPLIVGSPPTVQAAPAKPTSLTVTQKNTSPSSSNFDVLSLSWTAPSGTLTAYDISVDDGSRWDELTDEGTDTSADITAGDFDMHPGNTYKIKIRAEDSDGDGAASSAVEIVLIGADIGENAIKLNWATPSTSGISNWQYKRGSGSWTSISGSGASTTSFTDTGRSTHSSLRYTVRVRNSSNTTLITSFILPVVVCKISYGAHGLTEKLEDFGSSTAHCGDGRTLFVGADVANGQKGAVHIFTRSGPVWTHDDTISDNTHGLSFTDVVNFGSALAFSADCSTLAVGANSAGDVTGSGAVHLFTRSGSTWSHDTTFKSGTHGLTLTNRAEKIAHSVIIDGRYLEYYTSIVAFACEGTNTMNLRIGPLAPKMKIYFGPLGHFGIPVGDGFTVTTAGPPEETDGAGEAEPDAPLTASFHDVPSTHDGTEFTFEFRLSEDVSGLSPATRRDASLTAGGASIKRAQRKTAGSNQHWRITVTPDGTDEISLSVLDTGSCDDVGAICTADGRGLSLRQAQLISYLAPPSQQTAPTPQPTPTPTPTLEPTPTPTPEPTPPFSVNWEPPSTHDGTAFTFRLSFSERPAGFSYGYPKFTAIKAENGQVLKAKRVRNVGARNRHWDITVNPLSNDPVRLDFYGPDLKVYDDGQKLASRVSQWVQGPQ